MRLPATGLTLPWQLVAAQEPGPRYFCGSVVFVGGEPAAAKVLSSAAHKSAWRAWIFCINMKSV
jgi:hypothetical protein